MWSGIQDGFQPARPEDDGHYKGFFISWVGAAHRYQRLDGRALPDRLITTNNPALRSTHGSVDLSHCFLRCMIRWMRRMAKTAMSSYIGLGYISCKSEIPVSLTSARTSSEEAQ
uniref:Uncharacterized protein n=1 Tax=Coccidioides posadasii RMSCC 3488 TaxID=454284 RepID=A0A0J6F536_COCPO|nr:hypothetical protein CPAG_00431 [Coccidioides posadasii RMSCC 3488]